MFSGLFSGTASMALLSALLWGGGDFAGGLGVKRAGGKPVSALLVVMLSHAVTLTALLAIVFAQGAVVPHGALLGWGLLAGLAAGISLSSFYMALSRGAMGASAAVSGLLAAAIPAGVSMGIEGAPSPLRLGGFALAAVAIWMIAAGAASDHAQPGTIWLAVTAGIGFGVYFTALRMANPLGVFMPMALARVGSLVTCAVILSVFVARGKGSGWTMDGRAAALAVAAGTLDTCGNLFFVAATRAGRLDVAAVLASLYPASTILLAGWLLHEKLARRQVWGMLIAVAAVLMISI